MEPTETVTDGLVWHYTDGPGLLSIVQSDTLWCTASSFLNDAGEVTLGARMLVEELQRRTREDPRYEMLLPFADRAEDARPGGPDQGPSPGTFFILSAARSRDLLAMWRLYGGRGESYAVGLDPEQELSVLGRADSDPHDVRVQRWPWRPVRYSASDQQLLLDAVFDELPEELRIAQRHLADGGGAEDLVAPLAGLRDDMEAALMLIKHEGFVDERETRYCVGMHQVPSAAVTSTLPPDLTRFRPTRYGMAPYLVLTGGAGTPVATQAQPLPIRAVAVSPSPNGQAATDSIRAALMAAGYDVPVIRSRIPFRE
ncbi:DUF2971 domain-containing protein [Luteipulveratus halotolerans]|uniref:DUF2971 domain-containing protein n=1 Tax=Luteipulveratus halotolerans TaxID=1631356 RepID=A0A0L6CH64_9MICO|nr:DUF2971 domain-containing protein [Luteipulveratus halotolerans]KNX37142.1 hypothetical protein VV01_08275 [Luteipulveratus halotolerans]